ncbi:XRE family transcriptional regulator [Catellatospora chokoriensis]|uniref:Transcriptional regulator n=1 Tax=Catellatospora chokoriensis TaxID=310353 RepID=A0A8J3JUN4_9ACTN|nr:XRE family transcriptional regulator [Catellatospora chokoriensis]GIF91386.1 transcriptional regulator [Catellatospora chokoriensis]
MSTGVNSANEDVGALTARLRLDRGWSRQRLAHEFERLARQRGESLPPKDSIIKQIYRVESGRIQIPQQPYVSLWCEVFGVDPTELFAVTPPVGTAPMDETGSYAVTSHKFIPVYLGGEGASALVDRGGLAPAAGQWWVGCHKQSIMATDASADLYVWPWGVALVHLREELEFDTLTELACWRRGSYPESRAWVDAQVRAITGDPTVSSHYCFSGYWLTRAKWEGERLDRAVRLLSMPAQLLQRVDQTDDAAALLASGRQVEQVMMSDGVERADLVGFGASGVSVAYASWSSVAYHPLVTDAALPESEVVACELLVQGIWCYTRQILRQVENGVDPVVSASFGWRFLRAVRSRLTVAAAEETGQAHSMRAAVLETSKLVPQLDAALAALRDTEAGA